MHKRLLYFIGLIIIILSNSSVIAQMLPLKNYSTKDGLPQSSVKCIFQDSTGFIWFGTFNGISKFNGTKFVNYNVENGLSDNNVSSILEDSKGNLWITTSQGLDRLTDTMFVQETWTRRADKIVEDSKGNLFLDGGMRELIKYDRENPVAIVPESGKWKAPIADIFIDSDDVLWILTNRGLYTYNGFQINTVILEEKSFFSNAVCMLIDHEKNIWIGTEEGLHKYFNGEVKSFSRESGLADNHVLCLMEDSNNTLWAGTFGGVNKIDDNGISTYTVRNGFPDNIIISMFEDREGIKWFGTNGGGVSKLTNEMFLNITKEIGLEDELVMAIEQDTRGNYWFGSFNGGITVYDGSSFGSITKENGLPDNRVWSIKRDSRGNMWIGTEAGVVRYDGYMFHNVTENSPLSDETVYSITEDDDGTLWFASGLGPYRYKNGALQNYGEEIGYKDVIWSLCKDSRGELWAGTNSDGVLNITRGEIYFNKENGLPNNFVRSIFEDHNGNLWFGTDAGLVVYDGTRLRTFTKEDGLSDNTCYSIIEDDNHNLFIGTNQGINKLDLDEKDYNFITYNVDDGLIANELNSRSCYRDNEGYLWFGTIMGVVRYDPGKDRINMNPPLIHIGEFLVNNEVLPVKDGISLHHNQNNVRIDFFSLTFSSESSISYYYRLEGLSDNWHRASGTKSAVYNYLPPGNYTFTVYAQNRYGVKSDRFAGISFEIRPPLWKSTWFISIGGIIAASLLISGHCIGVRHSKRKALIRQKLLDAEYIKESEEKYRKLVEQSHNAIIFSDCEGRIFDFNKKTLDLLGYSGEALSQFKIEHLLSGGFKKAGIERIHYCIENKEPVVFESELVRKDGKVLPVEVSMLVIELNNYNYVQHTIRDISERKLIQNKLVQTEKLASIGILVAGVAHELNNPLAVVLGNAELLLREKDLNKNFREKINRIKSNTERCAYIIDSLLGFSRKREPKKEAVSINDLIDQTLVLREYQFQVNNIHIVRNYQKNIPDIIGDAGQLQQVFLNLINNAYESMYNAQKKGTLRINTYLEDNTIFIEVIDNGPGIDKTIKSRIFDPFFTTKEIGHGTGLGLSVCFGIIHAHGGEIFYDDSLKKGAKFVIKLPLNDDRQ